MTRNRAKCKLCGDIIESFHSTDYIICKCGEISVAEGAALKCGARDYNNFLRVDDDGNEIKVKTISDTSNDKVEALTDYPKPTRKDMLDMLDETIKNYDKLPQHAMTQPVTHYDLLSALLLLSSLFKSFEEPDELG